MDPTAAELETLSSLEALFKWAGLSGDLDSKDSAAGSLLVLLGGSKDDHPRVVGAIPEKDFHQLLASWQIKGSEESLRAPTPVESTKGALLGRAARIKCGISLTIEQEKQQS